MRELTIDGVTVNDASACYVIAEIGHNHQGDLEKCKDLFRSAHEAGAHAVKLQKRDNRSLYTREMYDKPYENENSFGATYGAHREALEFGHKEYCELQRYARELGITFFATAFDMPSADFLADLDMPAYKIASGDLKQIPLLQPRGAVRQADDHQHRRRHWLEDVERAYQAMMPINPASPFCNAPPATRRNSRSSTCGSSRPTGSASPTSSWAFRPMTTVSPWPPRHTFWALGSSRSTSPESRGEGHRPSVLTGAGRPEEAGARSRSGYAVALGDGTKRVYPSEEAPIHKMSKKLVAARDLPTGPRAAARRTSRSSLPATVCRPT